MRLKVLCIDSQVAIILLFNNSSLSAEDRGVECCLILQGLPDGEKDSETRHENDDASIVVVVVGEPEDDREDLKHVEGIERLEEEQRNPAFNRHINLIVAEYQTSRTINN